MPNPGERIANKYRLVRLIGDGGMGTVYEAEHEILGTRVALKFLHQNLSDRPGLVQRFLQEAQLSARIRSPHVVHVTDVDQSGGAFLVMELLHGESLQSLLTRSQRLPVKRATEIASQILNGLEAAHALNVVHRDLKPDNVFITEQGPNTLVKILDFGIAKLKSSTEFRQILTRPGSVMGTPEYMAPEQAYSADSVDARSDLYSLGVMMYEMLSGALPAEGENAQDIAQKIILGQVKPLAQRCPELPHELLAVIERAMRANPDERFGSASEMREALRAVGELQPMALRDTTQPLGRFKDRIAVRLANSTEMAPAARLGGDQLATVVASTVPPEDDSPPATAGVYSAGRAVANTYPNSSGSAVATTQKHKRAVYFGLALLLLGGGGATFWYLEQRPYLIPPPFPTLPVPSSQKTRDSENAVDDYDWPEETTTKSRSRPNVGSPKSTTGAGSEPAPPSDEPTGVPIQLQIPSIQLPSGFPQFPGLNLPGSAGAGNSNTAPAPSISGAAGAPGTGKGAPPTTKTAKVKSKSKTNSAAPLAPEERPEQ